MYVCIHKETIGKAKMCGNKISGSHKYAHVAMCIAYILVVCHMYIYGIS